MKCIAIDDEPLALKIIIDFCSKIDYLKLVGTFTNPIDALGLINHQQIELIFVDINMPNISGIEFVKSLNNPPAIIFTTAYSDHALEGFEVCAVDYLVKPIPFERFLKAVNKVYEIYNLRMKKSKVELIADNQVFKKPSNDYLLIKVDYCTQKVNFKDIRYIEGLKDYIKIYLDGKMYLTKSTMKNVEDKLPSACFIRIHKSYIISLSWINKIENNRVIIGKQYLPIGDHYKTNFYSTIDKYRL